MVGNSTNIPHLDGELIDRLKNVEHFADFMLVAWSIAEADIEMMFLEQFGIKQFDPKGEENRKFYAKAKLLDFVDREGRKAKFLFDRISTSAQYDFLKKEGIFSDKNKEKPIIKKLIDDRNSLFHGNFWKSYHLEMSEKEKTAMMENAHTAVFIIFAWTFRVLFPKSSARPDDFMADPRDASNRKVTATKGEANNR